MCSIFCVESKLRPRNVPNYLVSIALDKATSMHIFPFPYLSLALILILQNFEITGPCPLLEIATNKLITKKTFNITMESHNQLLV
jgi:hypothetical protein